MAASENTSPVLARVKIGNGWAGYTGFGLAPRPGDVHEELDPEEIRRRRQALSDQVPNIERERIVSAEAFKLDA